MRTACFALISGLLLAGCGSFLDTGSDDSFARFSSESALIDTYSLSITVTVGDATRTFTNDDFDSNGGSALGVSTDRFTVASSGELAVRFTLSSGNPDSTFSQGNFSFRLSKGINYISHFMTDSLEANPIQFCVDCNGYFSFEIDSARLDSISPLRGDSLYVLWTTTAVK